MSNQDNFSPDEWQMITEAPFQIGILVSDADLHPDSSKKEFDAILHSCGDAQEKYPNNTLIQEVLEDMGGYSNVGIGGDISGNAAEYFKGIVKIVTKGAKPEEAKEYCKFLYEVAESTAKAYGEGFLGLGNKVSEKEAYILGILKKALGPI